MIGVNPKFKLVGILEAEEYLLKLVTEIVVGALFSTISYPDLKSQEVEILRDISFPTPLYVANSGVEKIILNSEEGRPFQFAYQLAHELGHMSARADLRFPRQDGLMWIEEAMCECCSFIAMEAIKRSDGFLAQGASKYLSDLHSKFPEDLLTPAWYREHADKLYQAQSLTDEAKQVARFVLNQVPSDGILRDNRFLLEAPTDCTLSEFLASWLSLSGDENGVPAALQRLTALD